MKNVTLKDVAMKAGVSPSTVSRVVSDDSRISEKTKQKVLKVMNELNYYPNSIARSLANKKTDTIGVIMPSYEEDIFMNPFFQEGLRGISLVTGKNSYDILIATNHEGEKDVDVLKRVIKGNRVDGIILTRSNEKDESIKYLRESNFPFVLIGSCLEYDDIPSVDNDNEKASYELTSLLIKKGRKKIAFIGGELHSVVIKNRFEGYKKALNDNNIKFNHEYLISDKFSEESGYKLTDKLLKLNDIPDSIIVADDLMSLGAMKKIKEEKYKVPKDIMLASFNNSILAKYSNPSITSIDINSVQLGKRACEKLFNILNNNKKLENNKEIVEYKIIERDSTKII
ncbi:LacI family DNA-binding transcriptional regulator [Tepidibacter formicigenes]|jgi:DNA-binding LacI/PurR family transcriptional regulator|uniref:Transcriptional regulator, LacI family n=1 Tax=Tepidibacter formicigenes DSM 15518 TaxID=1123349 RepID=A0A1M6K400_9FIRM|nr:LacI family DNA-binding transcriptional regulator [Tepidibacter formicigenes]SHJ53674.1 transcriptional regulator, LacI family [Tepidibacter formicigenes DSM 15518]